MHLTLPLTFSEEERRALALIPRVEGAAGKETWAKLGLGLDLESTAGTC